MKVRFFWALFLLPILFSSCGKDKTDDSGKSGTNGGKPLQGIKLDYVSFKNYAYVQTDFVDATTDYMIDFPQEVTFASVRPYSRGITPVISGRQVGFKLPKAGHYMAYINDLQIAIFADPPETIPSGSDVVDVLRTLGCDNTGTVNETVKIQQAIHDVAGSDRILFFPAGTYLASQLRIAGLDNVKIHLARGASIVADTNTLNTYSTEDVYGPAGVSSIPGKAKWTTVRSFIVIDDSHHVRISGQGMIDGRGRAARRHAVVHDGAETIGRYRNVLITRCSDVVLDGIISADPGVWNIHILRSNDVVCSNVKLINELEYAPLPGDLNHKDRNRVNTDGFDIDSSSGVVISDCFGYCADDNIAVKTSEYAGLLGDVDEVMVRGCVFLTHASSLKIGTETGASAMKNITFIDNDVLESDRAIALYCYDGAEVTHARWENNRVEYCYPDAKKCVVAIELKPRVDGSKVGKISAQIINTAVKNAFPNKSEIKYSNTGASNPSSTGNDLQVSITGFVVNGVPVAASPNAYFAYQGNPQVIFQ